MENFEKISWLQKHYGAYSKEWYLADESRLNAIFAREYQAWQARVKEEVQAEQRLELDSRAQRLRDAYQLVYHANYDEDFKSDRSATNARAQAIRNLWVHEVVA